MRENKVRKKRKVYSVLGHLYFFYWVLSLLQIALLLQKAGRQQDRKIRLLCFIHVIALDFQTASKPRRNRYIGYFKLDREKNLMAPN